MFHLGKGTLRSSFGRLTAMVVLLCSLSFLAAGVAPETQASAMYLITENGYQLIGAQPTTTEDAAAITSDGKDIRLTAGQPVTISQNNTVLSVTAGSETVTALLDRLKIHIGAMDMIAVSLGEQAEITIASELIFYEKLTTALPSQVTYISDPFLPEGAEVMEQQGRDGFRTEVYETICHEGQVTNRHLIDIMEEPVLNTVIRVGVGQSAQVADIRTNEDGSGVLVLANGDALPFAEARTMRATAYTAGEPGVDHTTATGTTVRIGTVAVDPRYVPYGTKMFIVTNDGQYIYGFSVAEDCGGAIKQDRIDLYFNTLRECNRFGRRDCTVYILED